jgi:hypothetical protein
MLMLAILLELFAIVDLRLRLKIFSAVEVCCWFILASQLIYMFSSFFGYHPSQWAIHSSGTTLRSDLLVYFFIFVVFYLSTIGHTVRGAAGTSYAREIRDLMRRASSYEGFMIAIVYLVVILFVLLVRPSVLWADNYRQALTDPSAYVSAVGLKVRPWANLSAIISGFFFALNLALLRQKKNAGMLALIWLPPLLFEVAWMVAATSRASILPFVAIGITLIIVSTYSRLLIAAVMLPLAYLCWSSALAGRNGDFFGIAAIPYLLTLPFTSTEFKQSDLILNIFQGVFITCEGLEWKVTFPTIYKLLSFSPLPSLIDGFDSILDTDQVRLNYYVPMPGIAEAYLFGPVYFMVFLLTYAAAFRYVLHNRSRVGIAYVFSSLLLIMSFVSANAYPVRNTYRQALLALLLCFVAKLYRGRNRPRPQPTATRRAPLRPRAPTPGR